MKISTKATCIIVLLLFVGLFSPIHVKADQLDDRVKNAQENLENNPYDPWACHELGWAYLRRYEQRGSKDDIIKSVKAFEKRVKMEGNKPGPYYSLGYAYYKFGDYTKAEEALTKSLSIDPNYYYSISMIANLYTAQGQYTQAMGYNKRAKKLRPKNKWVPNNIAWLCLDTGEYQKAIDYATESLKPKSTA